MESVLARFRCLTSVRLFCATHLTEQCCYFAWSQLKPILTLDLILSSDLVYQYKLVWEIGIVEH